MATKILLKKSSTGGGVPLIADLDQGELAVNLVDRKIYTKDNGDTIQRLDGAYVDSVAPGNPAEGDFWYDTANNILKTHDGSTWSPAGYAAVSALEDVTLTSITSGDHLTWDGAAWVNSNFETDVEALISVTDAGDDGSLSYLDGVFTYTGPDSTEVRAHFTGGTGVTITDGAVAIGQPVATTDNVTFAEVTANTVNGDGTNPLTLDPSGLGDDAGTVVVAGNLTVNGTTTTVNSNEVNIGDAIILLNSDETGAASQNAGFEVERGTDTNVSFVWDETNDVWSLNDETLANVVLNGGSY